MRLLVAVARLSPLAAVAQYKCTAPDGSISFQQLPCAAQQKQQALKISSSPAPAPVAAAASGGAGAVRPQETGTVEQRMMRAMERERKVRELEREITDTEYAINTRTNQMSAEMAALQNKKRFTNNNLAGATLDQSISIEMQAVAAKYSAMNDVDIARLKQLRADLATAKQQVAAR